MKIKISILTFCLLTSFAFAQKFLKTDGGQIVNSKGEKIILRGMGLGGWMLQEGYMLKVQEIGQQQHVIRGKLEELVGKEKTDAFYNSWLANHTRKSDIDSLSAWGFNSVRLPIHYNLFTLPSEQEPIAGQNTWIEKGFVMTDSLLKWCAANKMYLILDLHAAPGGQGNDLNISDRDASKPFLWQSEANLKKTVALWRKLAERYSKEEWIGAYDIINEPNYGFEKPEDKNGCNESQNASLKKLMVDITTAIREVDKNHIIITEGNCWGNNYNGVFPLWDNNMVISFHKYWNYNDQASVQKFVDIRKQYNAPVWLGESGENSNLWFRDAIHIVEKNEIGWAWWPLKKLSFNNPLEVRVPLGWQKILDYWKGGSKPSTDEAYKGMMELASNLKTENCIYHKDVIDAMFRQTKSNTVLPFKNHEVKAGTVIKAIDYDLGRNGFAYFDKDSANYWVANSAQNVDGNRGHTYRNDGVDISAEGQDVFVDHFESGEWLQYTVKAKQAGPLNFTLSVRSKAEGKLEVIGNDKKTEVALANTNGKWIKLKADKIMLKKGINLIRVKVLSGEINFQSVQFN
jgi:endoglucanase